MIRHHYICDRCTTDILNPTKKVLDTWRHYTVGDLKLLLCPGCYRSLVKVIRCVVQDWLDGVGIDNSELLSTILTSPASDNVETPATQTAPTGDDLPPT